MGRIVVINHITLDGVMQSPAAPDEDPRDGFTHGGWGAARVDEVLGRFMGQRMGGGGSDGGLLLGRRTYEQFASYWPTAPSDNPYTAVINSRPKYVVSRTLTGPFEWANSTLVRNLDDLRVDGTLVVLGSGVLTRSLLADHRVDDLLLMIHPIVLGTGRTLFGEGLPATEFRLVETLPTTTGVIIASYQRDR